MNYYAAVAKLRDTERDAKRLLSSECDPLHESLIHGASKALYAWEVDARAEVKRAVNLAIEDCRKTPDNEQQLLQIVEVTSREVFRMVTEACIAIRQGVKA